jgi:general secretion pathway protein A
MYRQFYGLNEKPFDLTPNPRYLYLSENHREALAKMIYGVGAKKGFIVITGEVGTGKTTLIHTLIKKHLDDNVQTAFIFNPTLSLDEFFAFIQEDFGIDQKYGGKGDFLNKLNNFLIESLANHENALLIIDEAHKLSEEHLEEIRLLLNLETSEEKLLQIILSGQPELNGILSRPQLRQLRQRIGLRHHIPALDFSETREYILHRLSVAGQTSDDVPFTQSAMTSIFERSGGIPRLINIYCDNALLNGYGADRRKIDSKTIDEIDLDFESTPLTSEEKFADTKKLDAPKKKTGIAGRFIWVVLCLSLLAIFGYVYSHDLLETIYKTKEKFFGEQKTTSLPSPLSNQQKSRKRIQIKDDKTKEGSETGTKVHIKDNGAVHSSHSIPLVETVEANANTLQQHEKRVGRSKERLKGERHPQTKEENSELKNALIKDSVYFGYNKWELSGKEREEINKLIAKIRKLKHYAILLEGFTDSVGGSSYNLKLSKKRVESVSDYLLSHKVPVASISTRHYGKESPPGGGQIRNESPKTKRRVDITVYRKPKNNPHPSTGLREGRR